MTNTIRHCNKDLGGAFFRQKTEIQTQQINSRSSSIRFEEISGQQQKKTRHQTKKSTKINDTALRKITSNKINTIL